MGTPRANELSSFKQLESINLHLARVLYRRA
ncbi:hypothetical protein M2275_008138 [Rhodococcus opacus]|nr:hypothetical protein [Rhodococcus opacus]